MLLNCILTKYSLKYHLAGKCHACRFLMQLFFSGRSRFHKSEGSAPWLSVNFLAYSSGCNLRHSPFTRRPIRLFTSVMMLLCRLIIIHILILSRSNRARGHAVGLEFGRLMEKVGMPLYWVVGSCRRLQKKK